MKLNYSQGHRPPGKRFGKTYEPIPEGSYRLRVLEIVERTPKNGAADYLNVTFEVEDGEHAGRKLWDAFHLKHASEAARDVSRERLDDLAQSCGTFPIEDTDQLIDRVCQAKIAIEEQEGFDPRNKVKGYRVPKVPHAQPYFPANKAKAERPAKRKADLPIDQAKAEKATRPAADLDDDIPF